CPPPSGCPDAARGTSTGQCRSAQPRTAAASSRCSGVRPSAIVHLTRAASPHCKPARPPPRSRPQPDDVTSQGIYPLRCHIVGFGGLGGSRRVGAEMILFSKLLTSS